MTIVGFKRALTVTAEAFTQHVLKAAPRVWMDNLPAVAGRSFDRFFFCFSSFSPQEQPPSCQGASLPQRPAQPQPLHPQRRRLQVGGRRPPPTDGTGSPRVFSLTLSGLHGSLPSVCVLLFWMPANNAALLCTSNSTVSLCAAAVAAFCGGGVSLCCPVPLQPHSTQ